MRTTILACETLRDEIELAVKLTGSAYEITWLKSGLHDFPEKLREGLQESLDNLVDCDRVLMVFGSCGNAAIGISTGEKELVFPMVDDCISLLIGSVQKRLALAENCTYFITPGWLRGERNIWEEYKYTIGKYGAETGGMIMEMMLEHYKYIGLLDDGSYSVDDIMPVVHQVSAGLKLEERILPASVQYICDLLTGHWDPQRFHIFPPHTVISDFQVV